MDQVWKQYQAENVTAFKEAVAMQQMPMFTYIYSNHEADTFYISNSWTPDYLNGEGDWGFWTGAAVPVETSARRWTHVVPFAQQAQITSPASGACRCPPAHTPRVRTSGGSTCFG